MKRRIFCAVVLCAMLMVSCGEAAVQQNEIESTKDTNVSADADVIAETEKEVYPGKIDDYEGYTFTFLNQADVFWEGAHHIIDYAEISGDPVNDAIYERNRTAEKDLNIVIKVNKQELADVYTMM